MIAYFGRKLAWQHIFFPKNVHSCSKIKYDAVGWDFWTKSSAFLAQGLPMMPRYTPSQPLPVANTFSPQSTLDGSYHWCGLVVSFVLQCKPENTGMLPWQGFLRFFPPHNRSSSRSVPMLFFLIRTIQASASCFSRQHQLTQPTNPSPNRWGLVFLEGFRPGFFLTRTGPGGGSSPGLVLAQSPLPLPHCVHFSHCSCWSASLKGTLIMHSILWQMISFRFKKLTCFLCFIHLNISLCLLKVNLITLFRVFSVDLWTSAGIRLFQNSRRVIQSLKAHLISRLESCLFFPYQSFFALFL